MTKRLPLLVILAACGGSMTPSASTTSVVPGPAAIPSRDVPGVVWPDEGPPHWTPRPTETAITPNDLRTRLYQISNDSMQGRRIGEPGNYRVTSYIASEFQRLGLKPPGGERATFPPPPSAQ